MWETRRLTSIWTSTACYRDNFTFVPNNKKSLNLFYMEAGWVEVSVKHNTRIHSAQFSALWVHITHSNPSALFVCKCDFMSWRQKAILFKCKFLDCVRNGSCIKSIRYHNRHAILNAAANTTSICWLQSLLMNEGLHCTIQAEMACREHVPLTAREIQVKVSSNSGTFW
jgi:hypothetical protein